MLDDLGMDGSSDTTRDQGQAAARRASDDIGARFAAVMAPPFAEEPVDLAAYLLDPPPSAARVEQLDRRRRIVRIGSLVAAGVLVVVLLAPMPGRGGGSEARAGRQGAPSVESGTDAIDTAYPVRVDSPAPLVRRHAIRTRRTGARRVPAVRRSPRAVTSRAGGLVSGSRVATRVIPAHPAPRASAAAHARAPAQVGGGGSAGQSANGGGVAGPAASGGGGGGPVAVGSSGAAANTSSDAPTSGDGVGVAG
jgi:hypothetical protein